MTTLRWLRASTLGWLLGFVVMLALTPVGELMGGVQFIIGVGIGAGVGYLQGRALSPWLGGPGPWTVASAAGMGGLFLVHDVLRLLGTPTPYALPAYVAVGGLVVGTWQSRLLRPVSARAAWWIPASAVGWMLPVACIAVGDAGRGAVKDVAGLVGMFLGGAMLGAATARPLRWILDAGDRRLSADR